MKRVAIILMAAFFGVGMLVHPVQAASGLTTLKPRATVAGKGVVRIWDLGRNTTKGAAPDPLANVVEAQWPGCAQGPCPVTVAVNYNGGPGDTGSLAAPIVQVGQVTSTLFVLLSGTCDSNGCSIHVWAIDARPSHGTTSTILANDQLSLVVVECGIVTKYETTPFTVRAKVDPHKSSKINLSIMSGDQSCAIKH